ncbi:hypothetical protein [Caulobacter sp. BE254]|uniref:hypothetical protein n=1 Tax=Caulobacter sp. BE254 TaxID=2817720 RepID=UPI002863E1D0|nr:hypothetical protein [Caulobacter sp. BE254]MDR7118119.1 hypothetical protein [Caulobacter sp. BE254]
MKMIVVALAALSFASPALAQEWPKQDWRLLKVTPLPEQAPASTAPDGGASPPRPWANGDGLRLGGPSPGSRQNIAVDLNSINRVGDNLEVRYFVWSDEKSTYTEITSRIDCSKTGEQVVLWRQYDRDFAPVRTSSQGVRRTDATARAVAGSACHARPGHQVSGKSFPEIVQGG